MTIWLPHSVMYFTFQLWPPSRLVWKFTTSVLDLWPCLENSATLDDYLGPGLQWCVSNGWRKHISRQVGPEFNKAGLLRTVLARADRLCAHTAQTAWCPVSRSRKATPPLFCQSLLLVTRMKSSWVHVTIRGRQGFLNLQDWRRIFFFFNAN